MKVYKSAPRPRLPSWPSRRRDSCCWHSQLSHGQKIVVKVTRSPGDRSTALAPISTQHRYSIIATNKRLVWEWVGVGSKTAKELKNESEWEVKRERKKEWERAIVRVKQSEWEQDWGLWLLHACSVSQPLWVNHVWRPTHGRRKN